MSEEAEKERIEYTSSYFDEDLREKYQDHISYVGQRIGNVIPQWCLSALLASQAEKKTEYEQAVLDRWDKSELTVQQTGPDPEGIIYAVQAKERIVRKENIDGWRKAAPSFVEDIIDYLVPALNDTLGEVDNWLLDKVSEAGILPDDIADQLEEFTEDGNPLTSVGVILFSLLGFTQMLSAYSSTFFKKTERQMNESFRPDLPDIGSVLRNWFLNPEHRDRIKEILAQYGIKTEDFDLLFDSMKQAFDPDTIREMQMRGLLSPGRAAEELKRNGFTNQQAEQMQSIFWRLPGVQDVIRFAVKEAFDEGAARELGLDEEYPEQLTELGEKQGVKEEYLKYYWRAHWTLPSPTQATEMYHRLGWSEKQLDDMLRWADYPKNVRENFLNIKDRLPTRVDIRRLLRDGHISTEEAVRLYKQMGYSEENAVNLVRLAGTMYSESEKDLTRSQIISGYNKGVINRRDTEELLENLGYDGDEIDFILDLEDYQRAENYRDKQIKAVHRRFEMGIFNRDQALSALTGLDLDQDRVTQILDEWELDRLEDLETPSRAVLGRWFKKGVIQEDQYRSEMKQIGWIDKYIDYFISELSPEEGE